MNSEQSPRRRGRPAGQFETKKNAVYSFLKGQQAITGSTLLHVSNKHIAEALGVCERQASRYINALAKEGRISTQIRRFEFTKNVYSNVRIVTIEERK